MEGKFKGHMISGEDRMEGKYDFVGGRLLFHPAPPFGHPAPKRGGECHAGHGLLHELLNLVESAMRVTAFCTNC